MLTVPEGFTIEVAAGPPLIERPIAAAFDAQGRLYVAESSGSNDPVEKQLAERPHRIVRLADDDGDGVFDTRTVFADRMMFPEGVMFRDGSLYVAAPPSIWKLTDADGDGIAEQRSEWFRGGTLTGCANDLHGPYASPDGWIYWCKGAFAEQTHQVNGRAWTSSAAHIFRCRPDGKGLEPVMTGGMDNPVDVVFMPEGERIFSSTFLQTDGRRDGLVHAIYGGVYGKQNHVLDGHPRTGELMPALVLMSPAAPAGLERYESDVFGSEFRDNLFACQFNLRKVSRHSLQPTGSSFASVDSDFVTSDSVDFHPTDVLTDADGSLLIIDTGGWYKLCCPTSQLWKPDVLGAIYRVRRSGAAAEEDPRGLKIDWPAQSLPELWALLADRRAAVRGRAADAFAARGADPEIDEFLKSLESSHFAPLDDATGGPERSARSWRDGEIARTWALCRLELPAARSLLRRSLDHPDRSVRHAALNAVSLHRDAAAIPMLITTLRNGDAPLRRVAAEALGRIGDRSAVPHLLAAALQAEDRILEHSIIFALIELADPTATAQGLHSDDPRTVAVATIALDQMPGGGVDQRRVIPMLNAADPHLRGAARWVVARHSGWADELAGWFRQQLFQLGSEGVQSLTELLPPFCESAEVQQVLAETMTSPEAPGVAREVALDVVAKSTINQPVPALRAALASLIEQRDPHLFAKAIAASQSLGTPSSDLQRALADVAQDHRQPDQLRVAALAILASGVSQLDQDQWTLLTASLASEQSLELRSAAAKAIVDAPLNQDQLRQLADLVTTVHPLELNRVLRAFDNSTDDQLALHLLASLRRAAALPSLRIDVLRQALAACGPAVRQAIDELEISLNADAAAQRDRLEQLLPAMAGGDVRRGHAVFYSSKAGCSSCHRLGYAGGTIGPELSNVGEIRTERDLLESILFPSLSFVQSYESTLLLTADGRTVSGRIIEESPSEYVVAVNAQEVVRVPKEEVEDLQSSNVSVMPAGLDKQLSEQDLADLVAFLKRPK